MTFTEVLPWGLIAISLVTQGGVPIFQGMLMGSGAQDSALATITTSVMAAGFFILCLPILGFSAPTSLQDIWLELIGVTFLYACANVLIFRALANIGPSLFGLIFTTRIVYVVVIAVVLFDEVFGIPQFLGTVGILVGILLAIRVRTTKQSTPKPDRPSNYKMGLRDAIAGAAAFGIANAIDAAVVRSFDPVTYLPFRLLLPALLVAIIFRIGRQDVRRYLTKERMKPLLGMSLSVAVSASTFMFAYRLTHQLALLASIHQLSLFFTIGMSALLSEDERRDIGKYIAAAGICLASLTLLRWG